MLHETKKQFAFVVLVVLNMAEVFVFAHLDLVGQQRQGLARPEIQIPVKHIRKRRKRHHVVRKFKHVKNVAMVLHAQKRKERNHPLVTAIGAKIGGILILVILDCLARTVDEVLDPEFRQSYSILYLKVGYPHNLDIRRVNSQKPNGDLFGRLATDSSQITITAKQHNLVTISRTLLGEYPQLCGDGAQFLAGNGAKFRLEFPFEFHMRKIPGVITSLKLPLQIAKAFESWRVAI